MRIAIGSDHAGYLLKETLKAWLLENGHEVTDVGTYSEDRVDYPHYGALVGRAVASGEVDRGVAVCGSGQGICMAANKVPGVRGGVIRDVVAQCVQWGWLGEPLMGPATAYSFVYHIEIYLLFVVLIALGPLLKSSRRETSAPILKFGLAELPN